MTETVDRPIRKFNPGTLQTDEEVMQQFVVRNHELDTVLDVLRGNSESPSCQHVLVVAPRGRGKTMLLARVAAELRTKDEFFKHLLPVRFMEENQEVFNLADFWLETLFHLARECASHHPGLAQELRDRHAALGERWREQMLEEHARAAVLDAADRLDRRLVLMVENLQTLCKDVDEDFGWKLRGVLQTEPQVILLASATSRFEGLDDAKQPFFEMFRFIDLKPLTTEECRRLWQVVSGDTVSGREMRPLEILTGGSPRLLVIVAGFARHRSLRRLMEELVTLVDEHTEYFRGHLEVFAKTERRVYVAVLDLWRLSTPGEIAARARMDIRAVSTMLGRLVDRGAVIVEGNSRKRQYAAAERLYSIYYKLRRERDEAAVVENLIHFMTVFYNEAEQTEMFPVLISEAAGSPAIREGLDRVAAGKPELDKYLAKVRPPSVEETRPVKVEISGQAVFEELQARASVTVVDSELVKRLSTEISKAFEEEAFEKVIGIVEQSVSSLDPESSQVPGAVAAWALNRKAAAHEKLGDMASAVSAYEEVVDRFGATEDPNLQLLVITALINRGDAFRRLADPASAVSAYEEVVERFGATEDPNLQWLVVTAQGFKGDAFRQLGDMVSAVSAYEEVVDRFGASEDPNLQQLIAAALIDKGHALGELADPASAVSAYEEVVERFGASEDINLRLLVATALDFKGDAFRQLGDMASAVSSYEEVVERFGASEDPDLQWWVATALIDKGHAFRQLGDMASAVSSYEEVVERFGASEDPDLQWRVATALIDRGHAFRQLSDMASAVLAYEEVEERFGASESPNLQECVAMALTDKGHAFRQLGDMASAMSAYEEVEERFGASEDPNLQRWIARALAAKGDAFLHLADPASAVSAYEEVVERFDASEAPDLQEWVVVTRIFKAEIQTMLGRAEDALRTCDELKRRLSVLDGESKSTLTWRAMRVRMQALLVHENVLAAVDVFQSFYEAFVPGNETMMRQVLELVPDLITAGAAGQDLVEILSSDDAKAATLTPLLVALRQYAGEPVREPAEVLEVASDIRKRIQERKAARTS